MSAFSNVFLLAMLLNVFLLAPCVDSTSIFDSHLPADDVRSFKTFAANTAASSSSIASKPPPLKQLLSLFNELAKLLSDEPTLAAPSQSDNETAVRNGTEHFNSLSVVTMLDEAHHATSELLATTQLDTFDYTPTTNDEVREVRYLYQLVLDHATANNNALYTKMTDSMHFLQAIEHSLRIQRQHEDDVEDASPEDITFLTSGEEDGVAWQLSEMDECKKDIQKLEDCDDDTKNSSEWCSADGDNTNALTKKKNDLKSLLVSGLTSMQKAESANIQQQGRVAKAREGVEASQQSPNITLEALSAKMEAFQYAIGTSTAKLNKEKAAVVQTSLGLLDGMKQLSLNLDASVSAARDEAQKLLNGDWHMSVEKTLRECVQELVKQANHVQDRTTTAHNMDGFDVAKVKHLDHTELLQSQQNIAAEFIKSAIASLINVRSYLSKAKDVLVEHCQTYKNTIFERHTTILTKKETMLSDLYGWHHRNGYEPAEMDLGFAKAELAAAKALKKLHCVVVGVSNARCDSAKVKVKAATLEKDASEVRATAAKEARDAVLVDYGVAYDDLRKELGKRGVKLGSDAKEDQPDNVKTVTGMYKALTAALGGILSLN